MKYYLYGASIQGIQKFIFETNKLKEIIGASEIVERLSDKEFKKFLAEGNHELPENNFIMGAAGNIRLVTENRLTVEYIVKHWQKKVESMAPGITVSQAVVSFEDALSKNQMDNLEQKLKVARNKAIISSELSPMAAIRSRRTGKPAVDWKDENNAPRDRASKNKQNAGQIDAPHMLMEKSIKTPAKDEHNRYPFNISDILADGSETGWLAVIHADGNGLGKIIQGMSEKLQKQGGDIKKAYGLFSKAIDRSTENAVKHAVETIIIPEFKCGRNEKYPFRPVVIGGDDLTIIIRADLAFDFTVEFLKNFQNETKSNLKEIVSEFKLKDFKNGLTACAGIAYMKASYPFHYTANLAEELCGDAKKRSKELNIATIPASIAFHKIQDSFVDSYADIIERELTPSKNISFKYGPYFIDESHEPCVDMLRKSVQVILEPEAPKSGIRKWLTCLHEDTSDAKMWMDRIIEICGDKYIKTLELEKEAEHMENNNLTQTGLYDVLSLAAITDQEG